MYIVQYIVHVAERIVFLGEEANSASNLDIYVQFSVQYSIQYTVQYSVQYIKMYIVCYRV